MFSLIKRLCIFTGKKLLPLNAFNITIAAILSLFVSQTILAATPRTPSQALPKMFQKPSSVDYYEMKRQEAIIPKIPEIEIKQQEDTGITITPETLIILAPLELQKIISVDKYQQMIIGKEQSIADLYNIALEIEKDFNDKGYPLVRVILPTQELEPEQATLFFKVIDGYIEPVSYTHLRAHET